MTRRVDRERPILGTEPKLVARGGEGREWGSVSKTGPHGAMEGQGNLARLAPRA